MSDEAPPSDEGDGDTPRPRCYRCLRPRAMCYCADLPTVPTSTRIEVLQHPHERTHPFGTARLVRLCMPNARVHVPFAGFTGTFAHPLDVPDDAAVLFPHADAEDLETLPAADRPSTLVVIDGTWGHAKRVYRENEWLRRLRHVRLTPTQPSRYRIRREPRADYISTLEAIVEALRIVEPEARGLDDLLAAFDRMIDRQIDHRGDKRHSRFKTARPKPSRAVPAQLDDPRLVVVYAEVDVAGADPSRPRELLHWVAARPSDGARFDAVLRPTGDGPSDEHLRHVGLDRAAVDAGEDPTAARRRFREFVGAAAPLAAWTATTLGWGRGMLPDDAERLLLKTSYCNVAQRRAGFLEQVVAREGLTPDAGRCRGRAGERLANAVAIARWLRERRAKCPPS